MKKRTKDNLHAGLGLATLISVFVLAVTVLPIWFATIDCRTATRQLSYMEQCIADENCTLSHAELLRYKAYLRMQIHNCKD
jgi:hypothetical protein